ncbi:MAG TPA: winged helix-turn-helix domain-containing protein [Rhizomicrobium sp.]|nr:winged helix-turn-helix domain-containing protein [Rhizomicrobium sp.]
MKEGPDIAPIAALAGDPARANILVALLGGRALTASELAAEAGVAAPTASSHLAKLESGGLIERLSQGRHRYFRLAGEDVAALLESLMGVAARAGHLRLRPGPQDPVMRKARVCYDHLAGEMGVRLYDSLAMKRCLAVRDGGLSISRAGRNFVEEMGIGLDALARNRRPLCRGCLDWSLRREHLAGALGAAFLDRFYALGWATRDRRSRAVLFNPRGERAFDNLFRV